MREAAKERAKKFFDENIAKGNKAYKYIGKGSIAVYSLKIDRAPAGKEISKLDKGDIFYVTPQIIVDNRKYKNGEKYSDYAQLNVADGRPLFIKVSSLKRSDIEDITQKGIGLGDDGFLSAEGTVVSETSSNWMKYVGGIIVVSGILGGLYYLQTYK